MQAVSRPDSDLDLAFASIRQLAALLRNRKISSVELTKFYLDRLRRYDPLLKCVVTFMDDLALKQAQKADREFETKTDRGPLQGIPWGMKDILAYPGYPTTWGAPQYRDRVINVKAAVAQRLEDAGAVLIAKLATNPFAGGSVLWYRGLTRTPWNPRRDAAGSSSGSGAATAAGLVGFSIGTETTGSIQGPASVCGAVGLVPTFGRVSRFGCMQLCWSLDKIGPNCRSADDCGLVFAAIQGADPRDTASVDRKFVWPSSRELSTIRVGFTAKEGGQDAQREDLRVLRKMGVTLVPVQSSMLSADFGLTDELIEGVVTIESAASFEDLTRRGEPKGVKGWPKWWVHGHFLSAVDYLKINRMRAILMERFDKVMQTVDVYVGKELSLYDSLTGHPKIVFPNRFEEVDGFPLPRPQKMTDAFTTEHVADARPGLRGSHRSCAGRRWINSSPRRTRFSREKNFRTRRPTTLIDGLRRW